MANLPESDDFSDGIYQIETGDPVVGGPPNEATMSGIANIQALQLARRTRWLRNRYNELAGLVVAATTSVAGLVRLTDSTTSTSTTTAATPAAVKTAMDNANGRAPSSRTISAAGLATGGGDLLANRTITVQDASQAEAEAGTATNRAMSPLRVAQAIANRMRMRNIVAAGLATGGGTLDADRTITVTPASQAEAEAGTSGTRAMTPLRTRQAVDARMASRRIIGAGAAVVPGTGALTGDVTVNVPISTQVEAEASADNTKIMTPLRVYQAIMNRLRLLNIVASGLATGGGQANASSITIAVTPASQAEAEAGTINTRAMTPLRTRQAIDAEAARFGDYAGPTGGVNINALPAGSRGLYHDGNPGAWPIVPAGRFWRIETSAVYFSALAQEAWYYNPQATGAPVRYSRITDSAGAWGPWRRVLHSTDLAAEIAAYGADDLASLALARNTSATVVNTNGLIAGTSLRSASVGGTNGVTFTGTWRALSIVSSGDIGLFRKVSV